MPTPVSFVAADVLSTKAFGAVPFFSRTKLCTRAGILPTTLRMTRSHACGLNEGLPLLLDLGGVLLEAE